MANNENRVFKHLYCTKKKDGSVSGGIELHLRNAYNCDSPVRVSRPDIKGEKRLVMEANGSLVIDDLLVKQIRYLFNVDIPSQGYLQCRCSLWGLLGENFTKFNPAQNDTFLFFADQVKLDSFEKRDGSVGYQINAVAYEFKKLRSGAANTTNGNNYSRTNTAPASAPAPASSSKAPAYAAPANSWDEDFDALSELDDLPFD